MSITPVSLKQPSETFVLVYTLAHFAPACASGQTGITGFVV